MKKIEQVECWLTDWLVATWTSMHQLRFFAHWMRFEIESGLLNQT
jgi:hypothetical protein